MGGTSAVFAGQGAQFVGMGKDLAEAYAGCRELFDKADEVLGYALSRLCFEGPAEELTRSNHCQPAIFVTSMACLEALRSEGKAPEFEAAAGLSLGEWSALHMAGVLSFEDALRVLEARGRFMQDACEQRDGAMVSVIGLANDVLETICEETGVTVSNYNSDGQTVLSGERARIEQAAEKAGAAGAKRAVILKVAGAYHSPLMDPAAERLAAVLDDVELKAPGIPVVANVTGEPHGSPDAIRRTMVQQVTCPVRWVSCVRWLQGRGVDTYVEFGPGRVLSGLIKRIDSSAASCHVQDVPSLEKTAGKLGN